MLTLLRTSMRGLLQTQKWLYGLTVAGVALGVASVISIQIINQNAVATFSASVQAISLGADLIVEGQDDHLDERLFASVLADPDVEAASVVHRVRVAAILNPQDKTQKVMLDVLGLDLSAPGRLPFKDAPKSIGEILAMRGWAAITPQLGDELEISLGEHFQVVAGTQSADLTVAAEIDFRRVSPLASSRFVVMDIAQSQDLFGGRGRVSQINVFLRDSARAQTVQARLASRMPALAVVTRPDQKEQEAEGLLSAFKLNLTALSLVSLLVGLFLIYTSIQASLTRRRKELGVLKTLGATQRQVVGLLLAEAAVLGGAGTALGLPLGYCAAQLNVKTVSGTLRDVYLLNEIEQLVVPFWVWGLAAGLGLGGAVAGALIPSLHAGRVEPRVLLSQATATDGRPDATRWWAFFGIAIMLAAIGAYVLSGGQNAWLGFVLAAALMICLPCLAPLFLRSLAGMGSASRLGVGYAMRSLWVGRSVSSSLTVAALAIAVSMLISITVMVGSFRATLEVWIDRAVLADVFISTATDGSTAHHSGFTDASLEKIENRADVRFVDSIRRRDGLVGGRTARIVAVDLSLPHATQRFSLLGSALPNLQRKLVDEDYVLVSEPFARKSRSWTGDTLELESPRGGTRTLQVAGVFYDYSSEKGLIYLHIPTFERIYGPMKPSGVAVYLQPGIDPEVAAVQLDSQLGIPGLNVRSNRTLRRRVFEIFEQTFAVVRLLQAMSLLIAIFGVMLTLFVIVRERVAELALYRSLGATGEQIFRFFVGKGLAIGGAGTVLGLVGGAGLAWILIFVINRELFGWTIQVAVPWMTLLGQLLSLAIMILFGAFLPAMTATQTPGGDLNRDAL